MQNRKEGEHKKRDGRRSSGILKIKRSCLAEIPPDNVQVEEVTGDTKRLSRRVSFADRCSVKEFPKDSPRVWLQSPETTKDDQDETFTEDMSVTPAGLDFLLKGKIQDKENEVKQTDKSILNCTRLDEVDMDMTSCYNGETSINRGTCSTVSTLQTVSAASFLSKLPSKSSVQVNENQGTQQEKSDAVFMFQTDNGNGELTMDLTACLGYNDDKTTNMQLTDVLSTEVVNKRQSSADITRRFSSGPLAEMELTACVPPNKSPEQKDHVPEKTKRQSLADVTRTEPAEMELTCEHDIPPNLSLMKENIPHHPNLDFSVHQTLGDDLEISFKDTYQLSINEPVAPLAEKSIRKSPILKVYADNQDTVKDKSSPEPESYRSKTDRLPSISKEKPADISGIDILDDSQSPLVTTTIDQKARTPQSNSEEILSASSVSTAPMPVRNGGAQLSCMELLNDSLSLSKVMGLHETLNKSTTEQIPFQPNVSENIELKRRLHSLDMAQVEVETRIKLHRKSSKDFEVEVSSQNTNNKMVEVLDKHMVEEKQNGKTEMKGESLNITEKHQETDSDIKNTDNKSGKDVENKMAGDVDNKTDSRTEELKATQTVTEKEHLVTNNTIGKSNKPVLDFFNTSSNTENSLFSQSFLSSLQKSSVATNNQSLQVLNQSGSQGKASSSGFTVHDNLSIPEITSPVKNVLDNIPQAEHVQSDLNDSVFDAEVSPEVCDKSVPDSAGNQSSLNKEKSLSVPGYEGICDVEMPDEMIKNDGVTTTLTLQDNLNKPSSVNNATLSTSSLSTSNITRSNISSLHHTSCASLSQTCEPWTYEVFCEKLSILNKRENKDRNSIVINQRVDMESFQEVLEARLNITPECKLLEKTLEAIDKKQIEEESTVRKLKSQVAENEPRLFQALREAPKSSDHLHKEVLALTQACRKLAKNDWKKLMIKKTKKHNELLKQECVEVEEHVKEILDYTANITKENSQFQQACKEVDEAINRLQCSQETVEEESNRYQQDLDRLKTVLDEKNEHLKNLEKTSMEREKELKEIETRGSDIENNKHEKSATSIDMKSQDEEFKQLKKKLEYFRLINEWFIDYDCLTDTGGQFLFLNKTIELNIQYKLFSNNQHQIRGVTLKSRLPEKCEAWFKLGHSLAMEHLESLQLGAKYLGQNRISMLLQEVSEVVYKVKRLIRDVDILDNKHPITLQHHTIRFNVFNVDTIKKVKASLMFNSNNIFTPVIDVITMVGDMDLQIVKEELKECKGKECVQQTLKILKNFVAH